jgi:hypothetical protein
MNKNTLDFLNLRNNVITLFYSLTVSILCAAGLYYSSISYMPYITYLSVVFLIFTTLQSLDSMDNIFVIHHLATLYIFLYVHFSSDPALILLSYKFYLSHITGIFSSIKYICKSDIWKDTKLQCYQSVQFINNSSNNKLIQVINENLYVVSFAFARLFISAFQSFTYILKNFNKMNLIFMICVVILNVLQIYWFSSILRKKYGQILNEIS